MSDAWIRDFLRWLDVIPGRNWLDVGCRLMDGILAGYMPTAVTGVAPSDQQLESARARITDPRARFDTSDPLKLQFDTGSFDVAVAGLSLASVPDPAALAAELRRVIWPAGIVGLCLLDAASLTPRQLEDAFRAAGLNAVQTRAIDTGHPGLPTAWAVKGIR